MRKIISIGWYDALLRHLIIEYLSVKGINAAVAKELDITYPKDTPFMLPTGNTFHLLSIFISIRYHRS